MWMAIEKGHQGRGSASVRRCIHTALMFCFGVLLLVIKNLLFHHAGTAISPPCTNWSGRCMDGFGEIEPKMWVPSLKKALSFVHLATREHKWRHRFAGISSFPMRVHSSKSAKRWRSQVEKFGRKSLSPCGRTLSPCGQSQLQFVCSDGAFVVVLCPGKPPSTGPKWKFVLSLEFLRTQQWGLGLDFKTSGPNRIFHDFSWFFMRTILAAENRGEAKSWSLLRAFFCSDMYGREKWPGLSFRAFQRRGGKEAQKRSNLQWFPTF